MRRIRDHSPNPIVKKLAKSLFPFFERFGIHVTANHFYSPIPDTSELSPEIWTQFSELVGVDLREDQQRRVLAELVPRLRDEYEGFPREPQEDPRDFFLGNGMFESVDAEFLYCLIRTRMPGRIIEIGSGYSSRLIAHGIARNHREDASYRCDYLIIDPYVDSAVERLPYVEGIVRAPVQSVELGEFEALAEDDILFIDSSHVLKIGSDVRFEYLEVLPRLGRGVLVHVHDVFLPGEYPRDWVCQRQLFWNEQYLLQAFLIFNSAFSVLWSGSFMHLRNPCLLEEYFSSYDRERTRPGSFWMIRSD